MVAYKFTQRRKKIYQLYAAGKDLRDIAKEIGVSATRIGQIIKRIEEKVPKSELENIHKLNLK